MFLKSKKKVIFKKTFVVKSNYLIVLLLTVYNLQLFSQDYEPIIKEGSFWDIEKNYWAGSKEFKRVQVDGEIEINNKIYIKLKQVKIQVSNSSDEPQFFIDNSKFIPIAHVFLRENIDEKKLYIFDNNQNKEFVLCDFNLNIGDTIDNYYGHQAEDVSVTITNITLNNNNRKVFFTNQGISYTEGVGKSDNNLTPYINTIDGFTETVFCHGNDNNQNNCAEVLSTKNNQLSSVKIYPNPLEDFLTIKNIENSTVKIFSTTGALLKYTKPQNDLKIDVSSFKSGIYILEISNSKGKKRNKLLKL